MSLAYIGVIPEVIVGLGEKTEFAEKDVSFLTIKKLHINLEDWLGEDLMEADDTFIVTENLMKPIQNSSLSGCEIRQQIKTFPTC